MFCSQEICHFGTFLPRESVVGCALVTSWVFCNMPLTCFATDGPHHSDVENFQFEWSTQPWHHRFASSFCFNLTWSWSFQIWSSSQSSAMVFKHTGRENWKVSPAENGIVRKKEAGSFSRAVPGRFCRKKLTRVCGAVVALFTSHPRPHYWHIKLTDMPIILFYTDHRHRPTFFFDVNESIISHFWNTCSFGCSLPMKDDSSGLKFENSWTNRFIAVMINIIIIIILMILSVPHPHRGYPVWSGLVVSDEQRGVDWRADIAQSVRFHEEKHPVQRQEDEDDDDHIIWKMWTETPTPFWLP